MIKTAAAKLMPLTDDALATVSGAHKRHCEGERRGHGRGFGKFTDQFSSIANVVIIVGDNNTVNVTNDVSQSA